MLPPIFQRPSDSTGENPFLAPARKPGTFHLALTMAGTVSAAAYTAGVVDFLIEAIEAWENAKKIDPANTPNHAVLLHAISGTSGGGITAAITAATLSRKFRPMTTAEPPAREALPPAENRLYDTWVRAINIDKLLALDDLDPKKKPRSLLNSLAIDRIAEQTLDMAPADPPGRRSWVNDELHVFVTSANLRGIPYRITFTGTTGLGYPMLGHFNYQHFLVAPPPARAAWVINLDPAEIKGEALDPAHEGKREGWPALVDAARATSAFPLGFRARRLGHAREFYSNLQWLYPDSALKLTPAKVEPDWLIDYDTKPVDSRIEFLNVDGGAINNEPFELARVVLSGVDGRNPRDALEADRAVILIDPLWRPDPGQDPQADGKPVTVDGEVQRGRIARRDDSSIFAVAASLLGTLIAHARFKGDELGLAADETVFSRFLVAPRSPKADGGYYRYPIFGELLGAFAAFLHRDLRHHDYRLGRENARAFLLRWFALPEKNPLFDAWPPERRSGWIEQFQIKDENGKVVLLQKFENGGKVGEAQRLIPVIPLVDALKAPIVIADRQPLLAHLNYDFHAFDIRCRVDALFEAVKREVSSSRLVRVLIGPVLDGIWIFLRGKLLAQVRAAFEGAQKQAAERVSPDIVKRIKPATTPQKKNNGWHRV